MVFAVLEYWKDYLELFCEFAWVCMEWPGEGSGTPLQYFCLENPMDGGAWWAAVHGVDRVGHDWVTSLSLFTFMHWRRKWQPTPVLLPGESQGGEAWWAAIYGVAQSQTRLKRLSSSSSSTWNDHVYIHLNHEQFCLYSHFIYIIRESVGSNTQLWANQKAKSRK